MDVSFWNRNPQAPPSPGEPDPVQDTSSSSSSFFMSIIKHLETLLESVMATFVLSVSSMKDTAWGLFVTDDGQVKSYVTLAASMLATLMFSLIFMYRTSIKAAIDNAYDELDAINAEEEPTDEDEDFDDYDEDYGYYYDSKGRGDRTNKKKYRQRHQPEPPTKRRTRRR